MVDEIKQVLAMIDAAAGSATSYSASLADASEKLQGASSNLHGGGDGIALRAVIERLIAGAKEMETSNKKLEARLSASRAGDRAAAAESRDRAHRKPHRSADDARQPEVLRCRARPHGRRSQDRLRAAVAVDVRRRSFQGVQRRFGHLTGDQVLRLVAMSVKQNRQGSGHRRALRRRGIRHRAARRRRCARRSASPIRSGAR